MKVLWLTFGAVFIAELGDKTQLAILALKGKGYSGWEVFIGAMLAFAVLTGLAVLFGGWLQTHLPTGILERVAAVGFVLLGVLMWFNKI